RVIGVGAGADAQHGVFHSGMIPVAAHTGDVDEVEEIKFVAVRRVKTAGPERGVEVGKLSACGHVVDDVIRLLACGRHVRGDWYQTDLRRPDLGDRVERAASRRSAGADERSENTVGKISGEDLRRGE